MAVIKWSARRQILYYAVGAIVLAMVAVAAAQTLLLSQVATCFDRTQNNDETGVDCGGSCALVCANTAQAPSILWARSFEVAPNTYTATAYVQNNNLGAGAKSLRYLFQLFDANNVLVVDREGVIDIPPVDIVPIVETNITTGNRSVSRTLFEFYPDTIEWNKIPASTLPKLSIKNTSSIQNNRITTTVVNDSTFDARNVVVVAVLYDSEGVARNAAKSTIKKLAAKSSEQIVFGVPAGLTGIVEARVSVLPSF